MKLPGSPFIVMLLINVSIFAVTMQEFDSKTKPILEKYQKIWMESHKGYHGEKNGNLTLSLRVANDGSVEKYEILKEENLPARFKSQLLADLTSTRFVHKEGEPNLYQQTMNFQYKSEYVWDPRRALIGAAALVLLISFTSIVLSPK